MDGVLMQDLCPLLRVFTQKGKKLSLKKLLLRGEFQKYQLEREGNQIVKSRINPLEVMPPINERE
jgi:hypothetical protein